MDLNMKFMALGGGENIGNSCYYLKIGNKNIILDAGIKKMGEIEVEPDLFSLITSPYIESLNQINQIFISHAHLDHVGYLIKLMKLCPNCQVYMTEITKALFEYQLFGNDTVMSNELKIGIETLLERITIVNYLQTIDFGVYKATFYPAGHIPGAMMVLLSTRGKKLLYTGDYSIEETLLTPGCMIPIDEKIDTLVLCGLHANHPTYQKESDELFRKTSWVISHVRKYQDALICQVPQLSKGVEFVKLLNSLNYTGIPIYVDDSIMKIMNQLEQSHIPILNQYNRILNGNLPQTPYILVTNQMNRYGYDHQRVNIDFTLHEDFSEMKMFIKKINPKEVIVVHYAKAHSPNDYSIEQELLVDGECRSQFTFAKEKEIYQL